MTTLEIITSYLLPIGISLLLACFIYVFIREIVISKRRLICAANYTHYSKFYKLKTYKPLLYCYFVLELLFVACFVLDLTKNINRILVIPDLLFATITAFFIYYELNVGYQNKNLTEFDDLMRDIIVLKQESSNYKVMIKQNEVRKNEILKDTLDRVNEFNECVSKKIKIDDINSLFNGVYQFISDSLGVASSSVEAVDNYFTKALKDYLFNGISLNGNSNYGNKLLFNQADFDNYFNDIEKGVNKSITDCFEANLESGKFTSENNLFDALEYCVDRDSIITNRKDLFIKSISKFSIKQRSIIFMCQEDWFTYENGLIIGLTNDNWWFVQELFKTNKDNDKIALVVNAISTNDMDFVGRLSDFKFVLDEQCISKVKSLNVENYSSKMLISLSNFNKIALPFTSKLCDLESMCVVLAENDPYMGDVLIEESFIDNRNLIYNTYESAKNKHSKELNVSKQIFIDFSINYKNGAFNIDKEKVYELFKEYEFALDTSSLKVLSYLLLIFLHDGSCDYKRALDLTREYKGASTTIEDEAYMKEIKNYVIIKNSIKLKRIINRIENKRKLYDDISSL